MEKLIFSSPATSCVKDYRAELDSQVSQLIEILGSENRRVRQQLQTENA
jgi:hypothetical protein